MNCRHDPLEPNEAWQPFEPDSNNPWSHRYAAHLLRRAGFGGSISEIVIAKQDGPIAAIDKLLSFERAVAFDDDLAGAGRLVSENQSARGLAAWWLLRMLQTPCPLQEKMTLFWHGHFATGAEKVNNARAIMNQNMLLRKNCLSMYEPLVSQVSRDAAMLIYLDSTENRKTRPNENYARELLELFCLGPRNYSERDIKEIARCFTGWEVRRNQFKFNTYQHDKGNKSFLGVSGNYDGDDAIKIILRQPAASLFLAKKLIRFFVFDDPPVSDALAEPIAKLLRETEYDVRRAVSRILSSRVFYSSSAIGRKIKSPVELAIGVLKFLNATTNMMQLADGLEPLGQLPLYPPNVKGWDGGRAWINAATILSRANLTEALVTGRATFSDGDLSQWRRRYTSQIDTEQLNWINEFLFAEPLNRETRAAISSHFDSDPALAFSTLFALPEFQLA
jgi:uncharacterized protein (DUF1800 family)